MRLRFVLELAVVIFATNLFIVAVIVLAHIGESEPPLWLSAIFGGAVGATCGAWYLLKRGLKLLEES